MDSSQTFLYNLELMARQIKKKYQPVLTSTSAPIVQPSIKQEEIDMMKQVWLQA